MHRAAGHSPDMPGRKGQGKTPEMPRQRRCAGAGIPNLEIYCRHGNREMCRMVCLGQGLQPCRDTAKKGAQTMNIREETKAATEKTAQPKKKAPQKAQEAGL